MQIQAVFGLAVLVVLAGSSAKTSNTKLPFISPAPGSHMVSPDASIIIRPGRVIDRRTLPVDPILEVVGSMSGKHSGNLLLADDSKTLVYTPRTPFSPGEKVTVSITPEFPGPPKMSESLLSYSFSIAPAAGAPQLKLKIITGTLKVVAEPARPS